MDSEEQVVKEVLADYELIVDSAEQPIERPREYAAKKSFIQEKRKTIREKISLLFCLAWSDIVDVKIGATGPSSDINLFREPQKKFNPNQKFKWDKAYIVASRT